MNTLTESTENMLLQLDETPDNRVLIGICFDALLEANREKEAIELECRCWLKAKERKPRTVAWRPYLHFFYPRTDAYDDSHAAYTDYVNWIPHINYKNTTNCETEKDKNPYDDFYDRWNSVPAEIKRKMWEWNP